MLILVNTAEISRAATEMLTDRTVDNAKDKIKTDFGFSKGCESSTFRADESFVEF